MTWLQQISHILKKDVRQRWPELAGVLALTVLMTVSMIDDWMQGPPGSWSGVEIASYLLGAFEPIIVPMLVVVWCVSIARTVHGESLPGRDQLWLTRPYDRTSLLLAKLLYVLLFVHLPLVVAQVVILVASNLPFNARDLLSAQVILAAVITLPAMTLASLTRSLGQFLAVSVCLVVAVLAMFVIGGEWLRDVFVPFSNARPSSSWMAALIVYLLLGACAAAACFWQYRTRRTRAVMTGLFSAMLVTVLMIIVNVPQGIAQAVEMQAYSQESGYTISRPVSIRQMDPGYLTLELPLEGPTDAPDVALLHDWHVRVTGKSGEFMQHDSPSHGSPISVFLSPGFLGRPENQVVNIQVDYVVETFDVVTRQIDPVSLDYRLYFPEHVRSIDERLQCGYIPLSGTMSGFQSRLEFACRAAFTSPRNWQLELVRTDDGPTAAFWLEKTRLSLAINPVLDARINYPIDDQLVAEMQGVDTLPIIVRNRKSLERRHAEFNDIVLADLIALSRSQRMATWDSRP